MKTKYKIIILALVVILPISLLFIISGNVGDGDIDNLDIDTCTKLKHLEWNFETEKCQNKN